MVQSAIHHLGRQPDRHGFTDEVKGLQHLERRITKNIKELLDVSARVKLVEPKAIERSQGKAVRVVDNRTI